MTMDDDRAPHGKIAAQHWPDAIPASVWCTPCDARRETIGRYSLVDGDGKATALHLQCGHSYDLATGLPRAGDGTLIVPRSLEVTSAGTAPLVAGVVLVLAVLALIAFCGWTLVVKR